jgi:hypothetical protein
MRQCTEHWQRDNLLSVIGSLAPAAWQIGSGRNQWRVNRQARRTGLAATPHLDGKPGDGALTQINAMIPLGGKAIPLEDNVTAPTLPDHIELAGRPCLHGRTRCRVGRPAARPLPRFPLHHTRSKR